MQKKFILNLILIIFVNLLIKPLYIFGVDLHTQNSLGAESYGLFYALFNLSFILSILLDPGITNYNNRHIAQNTHLLSESFSNTFSLKIVLSFIYSLALFLYGLVSNFNEQEWSLLMMLILGQIFNSFTLYHRSNLAGLHHFKADTFISVLDKLIMILLCVPILYFNVLSNHYNIYTFVILQTLSFFISAGVSFYFVKKHTDSFKLSLNWKKSKEVLKESYPFAILALLMLIYTKADTVLLKELHSEGNKEVGIYASAYRLIDALNMIAVLFAGLLYPLFSRMISEKSDLVPLVKTAFSILVLPAAVLACFSVLCAEPLMGILHKENLTDSAHIFSILIIAFVFVCNGYIFGTLLTANGNISLLNKIALLGVLLNIGLNILVIPTYGSYGAAIVSLITYGFVTSCQLVYSFLKFKINLKKRILIQAFISVICISILYYFLKRVNLEWYIKYFIGLSVSILILIINRLVPIKQLTTLVRQDKII